MGIKLVTEIFLGTFEAKLVTLLYNIQVFLFTTLKMGQLLDLAFRNL